MKRRSAYDKPPPMPGDAKGDIKTIQRFLPYLWPRDAPEIRARVVIAILFLICAKVATVNVPLFLKDAVDALSGEGGAALAVPVGLLIAYGAARVLSSAFNELRDGVFAKVAQRAIRAVGLKTFRHLHRLSMRFHLDRQTGGLSRAMDRGTRAIEFILRFSLFSVLPTLVEITLVCGILWALYDWRFSALTLATIGGYIVFTLMFTEWRLKFRRAMNLAESDTTTKAIDSLLNYETVKYFGNEEHEARRFDKALADYEGAAVKSKTTLSFLNIGQGLIIAAGGVAMMIMAAEGVVSGAMTVGDFVLVNTYLLQLSIPLNMLGFVYREIKQALTDMEHMFALMRQKPEVEDAPDARPLDVTEGRVAFDHVAFGYRADRGILGDVSFTIPPGRKVAIVGPSGAGKSTISRLLFRFYDVNAGGVSIDGQDLRQVTQSSLRQAIGIVPQDTVLFNDSIYYNIEYGRPGATAEEVEAAARLAQLDGFIQSLPDGFDTVVGERGLKLSGGEKQRVAIARAILKRPRILVFDEATSALDSHTEQDIQAALAQVAEGHTTLVIAHRLSTVVDADEILVLDAGRIVERGSHSGLLERDGAYAALWRRQQESARLKESLAELAAG